MDQIMTPVLDANRLVAARNGIYAAFFANGFVIGHWAPKIPVMVDRLGITEALFGKMIILFGVGAIVALVLGAGLVVRYGAARVLRWTSLCLVPSLILLTVTPTPLTTSLAMLWLGMFLGAMDNAMNAHGVEVEVGLARPVMSSYHGFWSLGGVVGGLTGGGLIATLGELGHALVVSIVCLVLVVWAWRRYLPDQPATSEQGTEDAVGRKSWAGMLSRLPRNPGIYVLGIMTMLFFAPEGTVIDWSALYLKDELGAPLAVSGYAVAAFSATMALMRFMGDGLRQKLGDRRMFVFGACVAGVGLYVAGQADSFVVACLGFFISGLGMANTVPILFSAAGRHPGLKPSVGIAIITVFGYSGLLFIPALVGGIAERYSLSLVFSGWAMIIGAICLFVLGVPRVFADRELAKTP